MSEEEKLYSRNNDSFFENQAAAPDEDFLGNEAAGSVSIFICVFE